MLTEYEKESAGGREEGHRITTELLAHGRLKPALRDGNRRDKAMDAVPAALTPSLQVTDALARKPFPCLFLETHFLTYEMRLILIHRSFARIKMLHVNMCCRVQRMLAILLKIPYISYF